ncbi:MAG TPA: DUF4202 domain-containing protein [Gammaproteobacteria bacterium]|nr:DUF4202 domain-containing protein [Gammaproteobacteria bacterium]
MSQEQSPFEKARKLIDDANSADPNQVSADGREWPKELLYSERMSEMLDRFKPEADPVMKLAIRAQHIERWKSPRKAYPEGRIGYLKWRKDLYKIQASRAAELMARAGYGKDECARAWQAVAKKNIKGNPDTQLLEDVTDLVFMEHYMLEFVDKHPEYDEEKWIEIIGKTWNKMSAAAQQFALSGAVILPPTLAPLIHKSVTSDN